MTRCELSGFHGIAWTGKMTVFHALGKEKKSVPLPDEPFDLGNSPASEKKQGVRSKEGQVILVLDDSSKGINAVAHIRVIPVLG
jgi:hypothetical protein